MNLIEERNHWREQMKSNTFVDPYYLAEYRNNRESELWRSTRAVEQLCEYILHLESAACPSPTEVDKSPIHLTTLISVQDT